MNDLLVCVAIPTFNRLSLLQRAISSVLAQTYKNLEIIISDNNSSDGTRDFLRSLRDTRIKVLYNENNIGMVANWDNCLNNAQGEYFLLMSDDDALLDVNALEKLVFGFRGANGNEVGVVFSDVMLEKVGKTITRSSFKKLIFKSEEVIVDFFMNNVSIFPCATLLRTKDIRDFGGYSSFGAVLAVDACAWIYLALKYGNIFHVAEPLALYRIHPSLSSSSIDIWTNDSLIMQKVVSEYQRVMLPKDYQEIIKAISLARSRIPLGYFLRKIRDDKNYNVVFLLRDFFKLKQRVLNFENIKFILKAIFMKLKG